MPKALRELLSYLERAPGTLLIASALAFLLFYTLAPQAFPLTRGEAGMVVFWLLALGAGLQLISILTEEGRSGEHGQG